MPLAGNISTRNITGTYVNFNGDAIAGTVTFRVPQALIDAAAGQIIIPSSVVVTLDTNGSFSATIPVTDDVDLDPLNFKYTVTEGFSGGRTYQISLPTGGSSIDLSTLAPSGTFIQQYLLVPKRTWDLMEARLDIQEAKYPSGGFLLTPATYEFVLGIYPTYTDLLAEVADYDTLISYGIGLTSTYFSSLATDTANNATAAQGYATDAQNSLTAANASVTAANSSVSAATASQTTAETNAATITSRTHPFLLMGV